MVTIRLGEAFVEISANSDKLNKGLKDAESKIESSMNKISNKLSAIGKGMTLVGGAITLISIGLVKAASDAEETASKFAVVFQDVADEANKSAKNLADNFGLSANAAKQLLSNTGDLLTGFGFTGAAALDLSTKVNELAVDLASFTNFSGGAEGASQALTKALLGERESVKALGISILETDVKAKVLEMTKQGLTFETERQAKAYATLLIAQQQSKNAMGDFARTQDSFANQMRILKARINDLVVSLGEKLLPIATELIGRVTKIVTKIGEWVKSHEELVGWIVKVTAVLGALAAVGGPILMAVAAFMKMQVAITLVSAAIKALAIASGPIGWLILAIGGLYTAWTTNLFGMRDKTIEVFDSIKGNFVDLSNTLTGGGGGAEAFFGELEKGAEKVTESFEDILAQVNKMGAIGDIFQPAEEAIQKIVDSMTLYEKQLEAINVKYDEAIEKIKIYILDEEELKAAIDKLNKGRDAEITLLDRQETALEKVAEAKQKLIDLTKSLTDKIYEFTHTEEEVRLRDINREYDLLIENAKEIFIEYNELRTAITAINEKRKEEIDGLKGVNEGTDEAIEANKDLTESIEEVTEATVEAAVAAKNVGILGGKGWDDITVKIKHATVALNNFTKEGLAAAIATIKMKFYPIIMDLQNVINTATGIFKKIAEANLESIKKTMYEQIDVLKYGLDVYNKTLTQLGGAGSSGKIGSFQTGTPYVPKTGLYQLHQGEAVIPKNQNTYNNSNSFSPTVNLTVSGGGNAQNIAYEVKKVLEDSARQFRRSGFELVPGRG